MRKKLPKLLVTGGAGFIGSAFVRLAARKGYKIVVVDKLTYAGDKARLQEVEGKIRFYKENICNKQAIEKIFAKEKPGLVVNFAAETHVDRSILDSKDFLLTNIRGTQVLMDAARKVRAAKFVQISTDETYGDIIKGGFSEHTALNPSSPYAASKAAADLLVRSYIRTYGFPAVIVRPSNNYGPWQYPEKLVPVIIYKAIRNERVPIYAKGKNVREWLYVDDCAEAILLAAEKGKPGEIYNVSSGIEKQNIFVAASILKLLNKGRGLIEFVKDRPGHDIRYSLSFSKIRRELGWKPRTGFEKGLEKTVSWYRYHFTWLETKAKYLKGYWKKVYK